MNKKQIVFTFFLCCLVTAAFALYVMSESELLFHEAFIAVFACYAFFIILGILGIGCGIVYEKLGEG